ncbi:uncharacterized protein LOC108865214 [Galendromus occidentalis]|uniref:Uncharacterized protein LOC108865214 n=1 Tax=Galendromus occidentalis TaxID=34638 RepID=A0AAJ7PB61_9ACAR|nr:uncharacterized protein LOC108865214 [Galendromus occidentalis]
MNQDVRITRGPIGRGSNTDAMNRFSEKHRMERIDASHPTRKSDGALKPKHREGRCEKTRKRSASREASSLPRLPVSSMSGDLKTFVDLPIGMLSGVESTTVDTIVPNGFLRVENATNTSMKSSRNAERSLPLEDMMLYNWQKKTMSVLRANRVLEETWKIRDPLAQALCRASSIIMRNNDVYVSVALCNSYAVQVYDLESGQLIAHVFSYYLPGSRKILLSSYHGRIYLAELGKKAIFEISSEYRLRRVAVVGKPIGNFWVDRHDLVSFACTYIQSDNGLLHAFLWARDHEINFELNHADLFNCLMFGCHDGNYFLLSRDSRRIRAVNGRTETWRIELPEKIIFPHSFKHCKESIYLLTADKIHVFNTKTRLTSTIDCSRAARQLDEECRLILRMTTSLSAIDAKR